MITESDLEGLDFTTSSTGSRVVGRKPINVETLEDGEYCEFILVVAIRSKEYCRISQYYYHHADKKPSLVDLQDVKRYTLYSGIIRDKVHLEQVLEDVLEFYI